MTAEDFATVRALVGARAGLRLEDGKEYLVRARLEPVAAEAGFDDLRALLAGVREDGTESLRARIVEALTVGETSFFRDTHPFTALRQTFLPDLLARAGGTRPLGVWSAGCSSGQEPYSLAILLLDLLGPAAARGARVLATDLSGEALDRARAGAYSRLEVNRGLPAADLLRHFTEDGTRWTIRPAVRELVTFRQANLLAPWPAGERHDLVFMRNVLMYFTPEARQSVLARLPGAMHPGGLLCLGSAERLRQSLPGFRPVQDGRVTCYRFEP